MRTLKITAPLWTAAIPERWEDFSVQFANDVESGFIVFAGRKFGAIAGSLIRGTGAEVEALFNGMIAGGLAVEHKEELAAHTEEKE